MSKSNEEKLPDATVNQPDEANQTLSNVPDTQEPVEPTTESTQEVEEFVDSVENLQEADTDTPQTVEVEKSGNTQTIAEQPKEETDEVVMKIEQRMASQAENPEDNDLPMIDYKDDMEVEEIVNTIQNLLKEHPVQHTIKHIEYLKKMFNVKFGALLKEAKESFMAQDGDVTEFHYENPIQQAYNDVLLEYKKLRQTYFNELEKAHQENLEKKLAVIDELKDLVENGNPDTMYKTFKDIQTRWRETGPVPKENYVDTWRTYQFHVERFYDLLHLSNELRDLDFKHNYDEKLKLVTRVEELADFDDVKAAFEELQILHRLWKEEIGPVSREHREELWNRFSEATRKIHDRRHEYFDVIKGEFEENLKKKEELLEKLENFNKQENKTHSDWQKNLKEVEKLRKKFIETGRVPRAKDKEIWEKFREINRVFNVAKNHYYKDIKKEQQENLDKKMKLVEQAEAYRNSEDWESATEVMKHIQAEWKTIGHVPKQHSDKIWNRFKEACNHFFDRLHNVQDAMDEKLMSVYLKKKNYLENLKTESEKEDFKPTLDDLKKFIAEWKELGSVPPKQRYIEAKFNKFLDPYFENLSIDKTQTMMLRYQNMIDTYLEQKDTAKLNDEIQFVRKKIDTVTKEKQQMETNRLYFSNADDSNPMIRKILKEIEKLSLELEVWEAKLQYLRSIDF